MRCAKRLEPQHVSVAEVIDSQNLLLWRPQLHHFQPNGPLRHQHRDCPLPVWFLHQLPLLHFHHPCFPRQQRYHAIFFLGFAPKVLFLWACFAFQLGLIFVRTLTHLAPLCIFVDVVHLATKSIMMGDDVFVF